MKRLLILLPVLLALFAAPVQASSPVVSIVGDSISALNRFPIKYAIQYLGASAYHDYAVSGATTTDIRNNQLASAVGDNSTVVVVFGGTNDIGTTPPYSLTVTENNLTAIAQALAAAGKRVIFVAPLPRCYGDPTIDVPTRAALLGIGAYMVGLNAATVDAWPYFDDGSGCLRSDLGEDAQHPNEAGEMILAGLMGSMVPRSDGTPVPLIATATPTATATPPPGGLSVGGSASGNTVTVTWANIPNATKFDWAAIFPLGGSDTSYLAWSWVNCKTTTAEATVAIASGSCNYTVASGTYEARIYANNTLTRIVTSAPFTV